MEHGAFRPLEPLAFRWCESLGNKLGWLCRKPKVFIVKGIGLSKFEIILIIFLGLGHLQGHHIQYVKIMDLSSCIWLNAYCHMYKFDFMTSQSIQTHHHYYGKWMKMIDWFILNHNHSHKFVPSHVCAQLTRWFHSLFEFVVFIIAFTIYIHMEGNFLDLDK
jgi:hypothetical protein